MRAYGKTEFAHLKATRKISNNPKHQKQVLRVAKKLTPVIKMPDADWEFVVFKNRTPNAFALPGGKVGVTTGLLNIIHNDAMLAAVLGHEISHASRNHAGQKLARSAGTFLLGALLWHAVSEHDDDLATPAVTSYLLAAYLIDTLPLSRRQEYESDKIGTIYMAQAGYDPRESIKLWELLQAYHLKHDMFKNRPNWLRTHPPDNRRIEELRKFMPVALQFYQSKNRR